MQCLFQLSFVCVLSHLTGSFSFFLFKLILFYWVFFCWKTWWELSSSVMMEISGTVHHRYSVPQSVVSAHELRSACISMKVLRVRMICIVIAIMFSPTALSRVAVQDVHSADFVAASIWGIKSRALLPTEKSIAANKSSTWLAAWLGAAIASHASHVGRGLTNLLFHFNTL